MNSVPKFKNILLLVDANMNQSRNTFKGYFYAHKHYLCQNENKIFFTHRPFERENSFANKNKHLRFENMRTSLCKLFDL